MSAELSDLPDLPLRKVLRLISLRERIKLRLVCKRWSCLIECVKQPSLGLYGTSYPRIDLCARPPNESDLLRVQSDPVLNLASIFFKNVDYLYLFAIRKPSNLLAELNHLLYLQELTIYKLIFKRLSLKLLNLQAFYLKRSSFEHLELDAPKLSTFVLWGLNYFRSIIYFHHRKRFDFSNTKATFSKILWTSFTIWNGSSLCTTVVLLLT